MSVIVIIFLVIAVALRILTLFEPKPADSRDRRARVVRQRA